jgi:riboflavin biosynthesis pyrimidine reductase
LTPALSQITLPFRTLPSQLIELGLVDEYRFVVQPILAGEGRRLLEGVSLPEKLQLKLVESKPARL